MKTKFVRVRAKASNVQENIVTIATHARCQNVSSAGAPRVELYMLTRIARHSVHSFSLPVFCVISPYWLKQAVLTFRNNATVRWKLVFNLIKGVIQIEVVRSMHRACCLLPTASCSPSTELSHWQISLYCPLTVVQMLRRNHFRQLLQ